MGYRDRVKELALEEAVLRGANEKIKELAKLESVPFFEVKLGKNFDRFGEIERDYIAEIGCDFRGTGADHWISEEIFSFRIPYKMIKAIALGDEHAVRAFTHKFLREYRPRAMEGELGFYLVEDWVRMDSFDIRHSYGPTLSEIWSEIRGMWPTDLQDWHIFDVSAISAGVATTKLSVMCRDEKFYERAFQAKKQNDFSALEGDCVEFDVNLRWGDLQKYRDDKTFRAWLHELIVDNAKSEIANGRIGLSDHGNQILGDFDEQEYCDDEDGEDPFVTGELVFDHDGWVHFASDISDEVRDAIIPRRLRR